jgi:phage gp46-like protein
MTDISIVWSLALGRADWVVQDGDVLSGNDLASAVMISLFTDRRAPDDFVPTDGTNDRRGVWFDGLEETPLGSLLWTLERAKISNGQVLLQRAADFGTQALQWMLDKGVAAQLNVQTYMIAATTLGIRVELIKPDSTAHNFQFSWAWNASPLAVTVH